MLIAVLHVALAIADGGLELTPAALLSRPDVKQVTVTAAELGGTRTVHAVPLANLVGPILGSAEGVSIVSKPAGDRGEAPKREPKGGRTRPTGGEEQGFETTSIDITCADGFVAVLGKAAALNRDPKAPIAYLAVEPPGDPWPRFHSREGDVDVGPLMVVWTAPPGMTVGREQWPYQVVALAPSLPIEERYPLLVPKAAKAKAGFQVFLQNCSVCHPLNGQGPAQVGPDLNLPHSPIEYLGPERLTAYVRDPQSLHAWAKARMPPFPADVISDAQLRQLLDYFQDRDAARR